MVSWSHPHLHFHLPIHGSSVKHRLGRLWHSHRLIVLHVFTLVYKNASAVAAPSVDITIKELRETDDNELAAVAGFKFYGHSKDELVGYLRAGQHCYVAEYQGDPVSCYWCVTDGYHDHVLKRDLRFSREEEYLLGFFTLPAFRGMGILPYLIQATVGERVRMVNDLRASVFVRMGNTASMRCVSKLGFTKVGLIGFIEWLGVKWSFLLGREALPHTVKRTYVALS